MNATHPTSLDLAEDFVRQSLMAQTAEDRIYDGECLEVPGMHDCDCVPLRVSWAEPRGVWRLLACETRSPGSLCLHRGREVLTATYQFRAF